MGYRGRLIWPMQARLRRLDTAATQANNVAGQPAGYDRIFREPVKVSPTTDSRVYAAPIAVPCQVQTEGGPFRQVEQLPGGRELEFKMKLLMHYADLSLLGLLDVNGACVLKPSDLLVSIYRMDSVTLLHDFGSDPLFCVHTQDRSWGLSGLNRNLIRLYFNDREEAGAR